MLDIEYLPFFLTGIKSSMVREELRPIIIEFKLKAKDALSEAFLGSPKKYDSQFISVGEVAGYNKMLIAEAKQGGKTPRQRMIASQKFAAQFGIVIPDEFIPDENPWSQIPLLQEEK